MKFCKLCVIQSADIGSLCASCAVAACVDTDEPAFGLYIIEEEELAWVFYADNTLSPTSSASATSS